MVDRRQIMNIKKHKRPILLTSVSIVLVVYGIGIAWAQQPPTITSYTISNPIISPNGDGIDDNTSIDVAFSEKVSTEIKIENATGTINTIYKSSGVINPSAKTWDGTDSNGKVVSNGIYYINITMESVTTGLTAYNNTETITVSIPTLARVSLELPQTVSLGNTFTINVRVDPVSNSISGVQFDLSFDPLLVTVNSVTDGDLLTQNGASIFPDGDITNRSLFVQINSTAGIVSYTSAIITPNASVSSAGTLAVINLTANSSASGMATFNLSNVVVGDPSGNPIPISISNGTTRIGMRGDLSHDGKISSVDALMALKMAVGTLAIDPAADVNNDGNINSVDALMILQAAVGMITL